MLLFLCLMAPVMTWQPPELPAVSNTVEITGTVTDAQTGHPVASAQVSAISFGQPEQTTTTNALGKFSFTGLVSTTRPWAVIARGDGYQTERQVVTPGSPVHLKIAKGASLSGRVIDRDGKGIPGVWVSARIEAYRNGRPALGGFHMRRTNEGGEYTLSPLPPGTYLLLAEPALPIVPAKPGAPLPEPVMGIGRTYYDGASQATGALPVTLQKGEQRTNLDIELREEPVVCVVSSVQKTVEVPASAKVNVTLAELYPSSQSRIATGPWAGDGDFQICGVPAGAYRLSAAVQLPDTNAILFANTIASVSSKRSERIPPLELRPGWPVVGRLTIRNSENRLEPVLATGITVELTVKDRLPWAGEGSAANVEAGSGGFMIHLILGGEYWVDVRGLPDRLYVAEVRYEGREAYTNPAAIAGSRPGIEITLGADGAVVRGKAESKPGVPAAGITVALVSANLTVPLARPDHIRSTTTADDGSFTFANVPPGEYRLDAYADMPWYDAQNPRLVPAASGRTQKLRLTPGQDANITLQVNAISR